MAKFFQKSKNTFVYPGKESHPGFLYFFKGKRTSAKLSKNLPEFLFRKGPFFQLLENTSLMILVKTAVSILQSQPDKSLYGVVAVNRSNHAAEIEDNVSETNNFTNKS